MVGEVQLWDLCVSRHFDIVFGELGIVVSLGVYMELSPFRAADLG